jgi:hypothetical protein
MDAAFGIGCFHFGLAPEAPRTTTWGRHWTHVEAALREVGALDINIDYDSDDENLTVLLEDDPPPERLDNGGGVLPPGAYTAISFTLPIPRAFAEEQEGRHHRGQSQPNYHVTIQYGYEMPVAIVISPDPQDPRPSNGVIFSREYLRSRLSDSQLVSFECIGPSPFHAECRFSERPRMDSDDDSIGCTRTPSPGYEDRTYTFDPAALAEESALAKLLSILAVGLSPYYSLLLANINRTDEWYELDALVQKLIDLYSDHGFRPELDRLRHSRGILNTALVAQSRLERRLFYDEQYFVRSLTNLRSGGDERLFADDLDYELTHRFRFPLDQTASLLNRFETRGSAAAERSALYLGPLLGVILGAVLALLIHG